jgi:hypothetical protein
MTWPSSRKQQVISMRQNWWVGAGNDRRHVKTFLRGYNGVWLLKICYQPAQILGASDGLIGGVVG